MRKLIVALGLLLAVTGIAQADEFKARDFLKWPDVQKKYWIRGAMDALGQVAASKSKEKGLCVMQWYYSDKRAERNSLILSSMKKYPDIIPSAIMVALTERECGKYWD
ncbi:hypothetical protein [Aliiglaciecola aliphaticivorans]